MLLAAPLQVSRAMLLKKGSYGWMAGRMDGWCMSACFASIISWRERSGSERIWWFERKELAFCGLSISY
jgi:hypothetical protein